MCNDPRSGVDEGPGLILGWGTHDPSPSFGFAQSCRPPTQTDEPLFYRGDSHLMTVAPTGAGKGVGVVIPTLLSYRGPVIVIDPKGENYQVTARRRRQMGHQVVVLDPFRVVAGTSDSLNPLDLFDLDRSQPDCDAEMLASLLAVGHHFTSDPFWSDSGTALMAGLIAHVATTARPEDRTLNRVRSLIYADDLDYTLALLLDKKEVKSRLARDEIVAYLAHPSDRTRPSVRSTASTYIKALGSDAVAASLQKSSFRLRDVVDGKPLSIYLVIPPEKLDSHRALLRLWVGTLLTAVTSRRQIPRSRTLFLLDECAQLGTLPAFRQAVTLLRGYGLQIWSFWQDLGQLRQLYPQDWGTVVNNSAVLQVFGLPNAMMAREWADLLGCDEEELCRLRPDEAALFVQGDGFRKCRRASYLRDRLFQGWYDPNERFALVSASRDALR